MFSFFFIFLWGPGFFYLFGFCLFCCCCLFVSLAFFGWLFLLLFYSLLLLTGCQVISYFSSGDVNDCKNKLQSGDVPNHIQPDKWAANNQEKFLLQKLFHHSEAMWDGKRDLHCVIPHHTQRSHITFFITLLFIGSLQMLLISNSIYRREIKCRLGKKLRVMIAGACL